MQPKFWDQVIQRYIESGLKQEEFCNLESIPLNKFKYYWQKHRNESRPQPSLSSDSIRTTFEPVIIEKKPTSSSVVISESKSHSLSITFPNEMQCVLEFQGSNLELAIFLKEMVQI